MSDCNCKKCGTESRMAKFTPCDWAEDGFLAECPKCGSNDISFSVSASDINNLPTSIACKMLSAMYD